MSVAKLPADIGAKGETGRTVGHFVTARLFLADEFVFFIRRAAP